MLLQHYRETIAIPPGATIKEQLSDRGMGLKRFAALMALTDKHALQLINGKAELTPNIAWRLEAVLGIPAEFWNNLEAGYREKLARKDTPCQILISDWIYENMD